MDLTHILHFDPITIVVICVGFIGTWYTLKSDSQWHSEWIKKHSRECDEQRLINNRILTELQANAARLVTLSETHGHRIERIENQLDRGAAKAGRS